MNAEDERRENSIKGTQKIERERKKSVVRRGRGRRSRVG